MTLNKATDGGGVLLNGTPSSAINSAMYYETAAEQGSSIFRSISNGHMFINGNKRTVIAAFQSFAEMHGLKTVSQSQMMNVATKVATGQVTDVSQIATMLIKKNMNYIKEILEKENLSVEDLLNCFEKVKNNGDIAVIKLDGERGENEYTVFISFPVSKKKEIIRADENNLKRALIKVLTRYVKESR